MIPGDPTDRRVLPPLRPATSLEDRAREHAPGRPTPALEGPQVEQIKATSYLGDVILRVDPATARAMADALEFSYASGFLADTTRPSYLAEVAMVRQAAAYADEQAGNAPAETVQVPLLRVVGGELA